MRFAELAICLVTACAPAIAPMLPPASDIPAPPALWPPDPRLAPPLEVPPEFAAPSAAPAPLAPLATLPTIPTVPTEIAPLPAVAFPTTDSGPIPLVTLEEPYKLGERAEPRSSQAYREEIRELRHWGAGGTGDLLAPLPGLEGHPDPRVVINLERIKGAHDGRDVLRLARRNHWIQVVRCYRLGAYKDAELRGATKAVLGITAAGEVVRPKLLDTALADRAVADCIVNKLRVLKMPPARAASTAWLELRVGPGDEPLPPPEELIVPGDGMLAVAALREGLRAGLPRIEACYRTAFAYAPSLWGRMLLRFHLTDRGKLDEVFEAGTQFPDPRVSQCVVHEARKLKFPKPAFGDIRFVVGLRFQSDRSKHELPPAPIPATQKRNGQE